MEFFNDLIFKSKSNYYLLLICLLFIVINDALILSDLYSLKDCSNNEVKETMKEENSESTFFKIDIKGEVKKPGVYEVSSSMNVNDAIKLAGGIKKGATTENINLSKLLNSEMVIVVSKKKKSNITSTTNSVIKTDASVLTSEVVGNVVETNNMQTDSKLVSLNTATLDELMTLPGIGEQKAKLIIEYRITNKFKNIEDIKNVSGIGESLFEKVKDYITI